jgi:RNA polymerase sigma-70 factor (ECF subfamily)
MSSETTSHSLLDALRQGDSKSWHDFVHLYGPLVYSWCRGAALSPEESRDVSQEVFAAVAGSIKRFRPQGSAASFRRWLKTITLNRCRDFHRRRREVAAGGSTALEVLANVAAESDSPAVASDPRERAEESYLLRRAAEMVREQFEETTWKAFYLAVIESRTTAEVAKALDISCGAVRIAKCRVLARLRQRVPDLLGEDGADSQ